MSIDEPQRRQEVLWVARDCMGAGLRKRGSKLMRGGGGGMASRGSATHGLKAFGGPCRR